MVHICFRHRGGKQQNLSFTAFQMTACAGQGNLPLLCATQLETSFVVVMNAFCHRARRKMLKTNKPT
jgi:hypothetical protein